MPKSIQMPPRLSIFKNVQVSYSGSVHHARSESVVSINPTDGQNLIAASKRFRNIQALLNFKWVAQREG